MDIFGKEKIKVALYEMNNCTAHGVGRVILDFLNRGGNKLLSKQILIRTGTTFPDI